MSELDPKRTVYPEGSWEQKIAIRVAWTSGFVAFGCLAAIAASFCYGGSAPKLVVSTLAAISAVVPPMWFAYEYFFLYTRAGIPGTFDLFKHGQQVAITVWAGLTTALLALAASDFVKAEQSYTCRVLPVIASETSLQSPLQVVCDIPKK